MHIRPATPLRILVCAFTLAALCVSSGQAQILPFAMDYPVQNVDRYDSAIPAPETIIGHVIGTRHTAPHEVLDYFQAVAQISNRVVLEEHARSYEGNPLIHAVVTSPENHARLESILAANQALSDDPSSVTDAELADMPVIVYQGYSIHGNESSGTEAAVLYLYHLAAARGQAIDEMLSNAVVILDPMFNPDGRDRFVDWVNRNRGAVPVADGQDREHNEPWPGGRTNHYWFDLNRDWLPGQHPESQGRLRVFHEWRPQVLTDHHEMGSGSTFFFQPGIPSRNNPNTPEGTFELTAALADYHARHLDRIGSLYYTRESFDDFYYGKGSTYPDINGAVGILFEQASSRALLTDATDGVLHYAFTVRNQFASSLSTLEGAVELRERLLRHQRDFYAEALEMADDSATDAWLIGLKRGLTRAQLLTQLLQRHRVEVHELAGEVTAGGETYGPGEAYLVPASQPQYRFLKAALERTSSFPDSLFYDVSTWTLPLAFDVDVHELRRGADRLAGESVGPVLLEGGRVERASAPVAYIMEWDRFFAPSALHELLDAGYDATLAADRFTAVVNGMERSFDRGSVIIPVMDRVQPGQSVDTGALTELVGRLAERYQVKLYAADTGLTPDGPDLGSRSGYTLTKPVVGLITGTGASSYQAGEAWHTLSERFRVPVSLLDSDGLGRMDLGRYTTIVVPGGFYGDDVSSSLDDFARDGGTLIVMPGATGWAVSNDLIALESINVDVDSLTAELPYDQISDARGAQGLGGSIFEISLDTSHPLAFGLSGTLPVFHRGSTFYENGENGGFVVGSYSESPVLSGYISEEALELLPNTVAVVTNGHGRGRVIVFMDHLNFRAFWYGSQRLFMNAVMFGHRM